MISLQELVKLSLAPRDSAEGGGHASGASATGLFGRRASMDVVRASVGSRMSQADGIAAQLLSAPAPPGGRLSSRGTGGMGT